MNASMNLGLIAMSTVLFIIACGSSSASPEPTSAASSQANSVPPLLTTIATATPTPPSLGIEGLILGEQDMPKGFTLVGQDRIDNRAAAAEWPDPEEWLSNFDSWGRLGGIEAEFDKEDLDSIFISVSTYRTNDGAQDSFRRTRAEAQSAIKETLDPQTAELNVLEELETTGMGDESVAFHIGASIRVFGTPTNMDAITIEFREANLRGSVSWLSLQSQVLLSDVIALVNKQLEHLN